MKIVGVGCGPGMLTEEAIATISRASLVYGSHRAIDLARMYISKECTVREIEDYRALRTLPEGAVVLSTGDPMLAGLGYLEGEVIPGISSLQVTLARLHIPMVQISVVAAHGRDHDAAIRDTVAEVSRGKTVFLLADPGFEVTRLARHFLPPPPGLTITLCEQLGYPEERVITGTPDDPPLPCSELFVLLVNPGAVRRSR
ncbi:MAG TPA: cobalt-precorrin-7 (C(5))-methyltransferase [Methanolinea sp.]|nr:cobalt-precorrin-7 (C(5))-methyltransferase [Methanolinea sp.]HQK55255.1 cobalt-precorrin-7 (C(5))-methyltransferase [Methanolinea sp.]